MIEVILIELYLFDPKKKKKNRIILIYYIIDLSNQSNLVGLIIRGQHRNKHIGLKKSMSYMHFLCCLGFRPTPKAKLKLKKGLNQRLNLFSLSIPSRPIYIQQQKEDSYQTCTTLCTHWAIEPEGLQSKKNFDSDQLFVVPGKFMFTYKV